MNINNNKIVTKLNELNEARYKLTALEQKLILTVVSQIQPNHNDFHIYTFTVKELIKILNLKGKNLYRDLKRITKNLNTKDITLINKENDTELQTRWFSSIKYFNKKGYIQFRFDPELKPYLFQLKEKFVSYHLKNILILRAGYSIRMYELLKQYQKIKIRSFELTELKKILGIDKNEYKSYSDFKRRVLIPVSKEVPSKTDINFKFNEIKRGREVYLINFIITENKTKSIENDNQLEKLISLLPECQKGKKTIRKILVEYLTDYSIEYIQRNIEYTNRRNPNNYKIYLLMSLESDWGIEIKEEKEISLKMKQNADKKLQIQKTKIKNEEKIIKKCIKNNRILLEENARNIIKKDFKNANLKKEDLIFKMTLDGLVYKLAKEMVKENNI